MRTQQLQQLNQNILKSLPIFLLLVNMKLKNIKASFIFKFNEKFIFKEKSVTYTIYKHTPHLLNVTGVKSIAQLLNCKSDMEERFNEKIIQERVDNLFFSKKDNRNLDMDQLCHYLKENELYYASYVHELFPGMHLLPNNKLYPTIVLFRTGSFTLMGSTDLECIFESESFVESLIKKFDKIKNRGYLKDPC